MKNMSGMLAAGFIMMLAGCGGSDHEVPSNWKLPPKAESLDMVAVPGGTFQRDASPGNLSTVSAFRMSRTEISRDQFMDVMGPYDPSNTYASTGYDDPVQEVTWFDAIEFCIRLSEDERRTPVYTMTHRVPDTGYPITSATVTATWSHDGYRLPTEMEWMWAAMGATSGSGYANGRDTTGYAKPFAGSNATNAAGSNGTNDIGDYAWTQENSLYTTQPVGTLSANELGLHDMSGNVLEWCWDWAASYPTGTLTNYTGGAPGSSARILRGGSWNDLPSIISIQYRLGDVPDQHDHDFIGFRIVRR